MSNIIQTRIGPYGHGGSVIKLPSENMPVNTRAALDRIKQWEEDRKAAWRERSDADRAAKDANAAASSSEIASYLNTGKIERSTAVADTKAAAEQAQADLNTIEAAATLIAAELQRAVDADQKAWTASAYADAKKALTKLVTAARMAQEAADSLYPTIGVLGMYRQRETGERPLSIVHKRGSYFFDLNPGIEGMRNAISLATGELEALKPGKKRAPEPTPAARPTVEADSDDFDDDDRFGDLGAL